MMDRMHTRLGISDITLTNTLLNKSNEQSAISSTTCGYLNQQELNQRSEVNTHYQHLSKSPHLEQQQHQRHQQLNTLPDSLANLSASATTSSIQTPASNSLTHVRQTTTDHNQILHKQIHNSHEQQQHLLQSHQNLNTPSAQYTTRAGTFANTSAGKPSYSTRIQHTIDNSKDDKHLQSYLTDEQLHTHTPHHIPNQSVYNHLHHHAQSHYVLNHLNHNQRSVAAHCLTAAALAASSPVTSPSAISISSTTSGVASVTPSSAMAVAAAAHLHHNSQTSPMTNLHQNMGSLMNSGNSAR